MTDNFTHSLLTLALSVIKQLGKFLKLEGQTVTVELMEFPLTAVEMVGAILGILVWMSRP